MATKTNRLSETRMMNCGMKATIIRYEGNTNIDVRFEDGLWWNIKHIMHLKKGESLIG